MQLDSIDRKLLNLIQTEFPLTDEPYADLGQRLGTDADEVIRRIQQLKRKGIIRLIGPVLDSRRLGYQTTLVAMRVAETNLEKAERVIAEHPGVSHGYERDHFFNVWFTLAVLPAVNIETELERLCHLAGAETAFSLPAIKVFKIGAYFDMDEESQSTPASYQNSTLSKQANLSPAERLIINELQQDLPLISTPFTAMAEQVDMDIEQFLAQCRSIQQRGIIRRFSASINHNHAGFVANAMACWVASPDIMNIAGHKLASLKEVSHCYERKTNPLWRYNLFAMIHCRSKEVCQEIAHKVSGETGLTDYALLYSSKEFKKTRVRYLV
jgi:DNA-binding Lrp family transcriptional regulator